LIKNVFSVKQFCKTILFFSSKIGLTGFCRIIADNPAIRQNMAECGKI